MRSELGVGIRLSLLTENTRPQDTAGPPPACRTLVADGTSLVLKAGG